MIVTSNKTTNCFKNTNSVVVDAKLYQSVYKKT